MTTANTTPPSVRAALKELQQAANELPEPGFIAVEQFAYATDAVNLLLARTGFPSEHRAFVDAVIGASGGNLEWFAVSDFELGKRMVGTEATNKSRQAITKRVQRARAAIHEWQYNNSYMAIESMPGGQDKEGRRHPSKYKLNILTAAMLSAEAASADGYLSERGLKDATKNNVALITESGVSRLERFNRPRNDPQAIAARNIKTAITLLQKATQLILFSGDDPAYSLQPVIDEVKRLSNCIAPASSQGWDNDPPYLADDAQANSPDATASAYDASAPQDSPDMATSVHTTTISRAVDKSVHSPQGATDDPPPAQAPAPRRLQPQGDSPESRAAKIDMELFASVGASSADITITDEKKTVCDYQGHVEIDRAITVVSGVVDGCNRAGLNLIVRPRMITPRVELIPLDDLGYELMETLSSYAFRCIETSPGNYQVWLAVRDGSPDFAKRLKQTFGADLGANGSGRVAGSHNVKPEHLLAYGAAPLVRIVHSMTGLICVESDFNSFNLVEAEKVAPPVDATPRHQPKYKPTKWPSYEDGRLDRSTEDYHFVHECWELGWQFWPEAIVDKLMELSEKAQDRGQSYARMIVKKALAKHGLQIE